MLITKMNSIVRVDAQAMSTVTNEDAKGTDDRLRAKQLPAGVADLDASLPAVCSFVILVSSCAQLAHQQPPLEVDNALSSPLGREAKAGLADMNANCLAPLVDESK